MDIVLEKGINIEISSAIDVVNIEGQGDGKIYLENRSSELTININNINFGTNENGGYLDLSKGKQGEITINVNGKNSINAGTKNIGNESFEGLEVNAAIRIPDGTIATIACGKGNSLTCTGGTLIYEVGLTPEYKAGAGIGGSNGDTCGSITINCEGEIKSIGGVSAAGIGGGCGGNGNNITINSINGGKVEAIATYDINADGGAGIGGGCGALNPINNKFEGGNSGTININAQGESGNLAYIIATGGRCGAGIGGGSYGNGSGSIKEISCEGCEENSEETQISKGEGIFIKLNGNSNIQATSLYGASGIGGGSGILQEGESGGSFIGGNGGVINIMGTLSDSITAVGGIEGAGIGGGSNGNGGNITIGGALFITAKGGANAAGIGGGYALNYFGSNCICGSGGIIEINGQVNIAASGSAGGSGIGGGAGNSGYDNDVDNTEGGYAGNIALNNCTSIIANGSSEFINGFNRGSAGIGGGAFGNGGYINSNNCNSITAIGGLYGAAGIGGGYTGCYHEIEIIEIYELQAKGNTGAQDIGVGDNAPKDCLALISNGQKKTIIKERKKINRGIDLFR